MFAIRQRTPRASTSIAHKQHHQKDEDNQGNIIKGALCTKSLLLYSTYIGLVIDLVHLLRLP